MNFENRKVTVIIYDGTTELYNTDTTPDIGIVADSMHYNISSGINDIKFGSIYYSIFECSLYNIGDVNGKSICVTVTDLDYNQTVTLFNGIIESSKYIEYGSHRDIIAYDKLYYLRDLDVSDFWNNYTFKTIRDLRIALLDYVGLTDIAEGDVTREYTSDTVDLATRHFHPNKFKYLSFSSLFSSICELQCICPKYKLSWDSIVPTNMKDVIYYEEFSAYGTSTYSNIDKANSNINDTPTKSLDGITFRANDNIIYTEGDNPYLIDNNILLDSMDYYDESEITYPFGDIVNYISVHINVLNTQFTIADIKNIISDVSYGVGGSYKIKENTSPILINEVDLSGSLLIEGVVKTPDGYYQEVKKELNDAILDNQLIDIDNSINTIDSTINVQKDETYEISGLIFLGYITASKGTISFTIPLPKMIDLDNVDLSNAKFQIRGNGYYLGNSSTAIKLSDFGTVSTSLCGVFDKGGASAVRVNLALTSPWTEQTNNSALVINASGSIIFS